MNETFLIIEDQDNDAILLQYALKKADLANPVQVVENGREAMKYLSGEGQYANRNEYPMPALLFLDLKMPEVNGFELLEWIRGQTSLPPMVVVVLTSSELEEDIARAYRLGVNSYVVKPSSMDKLVQCARDFANWWLRHDRITPWNMSPDPLRLDIGGMPE